MKFFSENTIICITMRLNDGDVYNPDYVINKL